MLVMKKILILCTLISFVGLILLIIKVSIHSDKTEGNRTLELEYLRSAVADDLLKYASIEIPSLENIATGSESGVDYLSLRLYPDQEIKNNGIRAEVSVDYPYVAGETVRYEWEFKLDKDFVSGTPENRWWLIADWHQQPDLNLGEDWSNFETKSTPLLLGYGNLDGRDTIAFNAGIDGSEEGIRNYGN